MAADFPTVGQDRCLVARIDPLGAHETPVRETADDAPIVERQLTRLSIEDLEDAAFGQIGRGVIWPGLFDKNAGVREESSEIWTLGGQRDRRCLRTPESQGGLQIFGDAVGDISVGHDLRWYECAAFQPFGHAFGDGGG